MITTIVRIYLAILSSYHVLTGLISFGFPGFAMRFYKTLYGCDPAERRQLTLVMKPWGALALFAGISGGFAAVDPQRYRGVVAALLLLLVLRVVYRFWCREELQLVGQIASHRNWLSMGAIFLGIVILAGWMLKGVLAI
jgi:hypothetical protein